MFATVEVSLRDFDFDDIIKYVEDEGYIIVTEKGSNNDDNIRTKYVYNIVDQSIEALNNSVTARDYLTDILELTHHASDEEILDRVKQIINQ